MPYVVPGWRYESESDAIDIDAQDFARAQKFRNAQRDPDVSLVVDDVLSPWLCWQEAVGYGRLQREPETSERGNKAASPGSGVLLPWPQTIRGAMRQSLAHLAPLRSALA
jgi:hypothetical protein